MDEKDQKLWEHMTRDVERLGKEPAPSPKKNKAEKPHKKPNKTNTYIETPPDLPRSTSRSSNEIDGATRQKLKRGRIPIEASIDLHGMKLHEAHSALTHFILNAHNQGKRCVLVITGKGKIALCEHNIPKEGVIKRSLPKWLGEAPLKDIVLEFAAAQPSDGGGGAFYIYLRRNRS